VVGLAGRTGKRRLVVALGATCLVLAAMPLLASVPLVIAANALLWFVVTGVAIAASVLLVYRLSTGLPRDPDEEVLK